jgi:hypothetical protein
MVAANTGKGPNVVVVVEILGRIEMCLGVIGKILMSRI